MSLILERLRSGNRWWAAELVTRTAGIILIATFWRTLQTAHRWVVMPPPHHATGPEFAICALGFILLTTGLAFSIEGPGLLRLVPIPKRSAFFRSEDA